MAGSSSSSDKDGLLYMPTWTIAAVCTVFIVCCLGVERLIFAIGKFFKRKGQKALFRALEKIKEELMLVGFISLALTIGQDSVEKIQIPYSWSISMQQCHKTEKKPLEQEEVPFMTSTGLHQLHILLFVLAVVHVVYSVMIMALGMWKVSQWKGWEERSLASSSMYGDPRLTKDATFIKRHANRWSKNIFLAYLAAFFQQFFMSVSESDYHTLRHGFIVKHDLPSDYDFHTYLVQSLEEDFEDVVGVSPYLWGYTIILVLLNVDGWKVNIIAAILPLAMVLIVGTKLQYIITRMAVQYHEKHAVVQGMVNVKPTDELFWFRRPNIILHIVHFVLFQDAYQVSLHLWSKYCFSHNTCLSQHDYEVIIRLSLGVIAQALLGYMMLPIYAIVSQMGSEIRHQVVNDSIIMGSGTKSHNKTLRELEKRSDEESAPPTSLIAMSEEFGQHQVTRKENYFQHRG